MISHNFILVYNEAECKLQQVLEFGEDSAAAFRKYEALETEYRDEPFMNILLVGADSLETVKKNHTSYFPEEARKLLEEAFGPLNRA